VPGLPFLNPRLPYVSFGVFLVRKMCLLFIGFLGIKSSITMFFDGQTSYLLIKKNIHKPVNNIAYTPMGLGKHVVGLIG